MKYYELYDLFGDYLHSKISTDIINLLIKKGININHKYNNENCIFTKFINYNVLKLLIRKGININLINNYGANALNFAILNKRPLNIIKLLIKNKIKIQNLSKYRQQIIYHFNNSNFEILMHYADYILLNYNTKYKQYINIIIFK